MKVQYLIFMVFGIILSFNKAWTYPWPVVNTSQPHLISGTLGEHRARPFVHFHAGVDIAEGAGVDMPPISGQT